MGIPRVEAGANFYFRIHSLLKPEHVVLDLGAGRGGGIENVRPDFRRDMMILRGKCRKVIGVDVDEAVLQNPYLDEAHIVAPGNRLPFDEATFDLIYSDWTFEHVQDPEGFLREARRVLKPGGWLCARTPNAMSYQGLITRLVPNRLHTAVLRRLQPSRQEKDVFETYLK